MVEMSSAVLTTMIGMLGVIVGAVISNYFNQRIVRKSARKDIIFKKKMEYFEKVVNCVEKNTELYSNYTKSIEKNTKNPKKVLDKVKRERQNFDIMTSPLYLDVKPISNRIKQFVNSEKKAFLYFERLKNSKGEEREEIIRGLKINQKELEIIGERIIQQLRNELSKE